MSMAQATGSASAPLWEGFDQRQLRLPFCGACGKAHLPPGPLCPFCLSEDLQWRGASGRAVLSTWVVEHRKVQPEFEPPYAIGQVELAEGPRLVASLAMDDLPRFRLGGPGSITFYETSDGRVLPMFRPDDG